MRIAWFTPFSNRSAIGRFSGIVAAELSKLAEVDLCHFERSDVREFKGSIKRYASAESVSIEELASYDAVIYNFGNHLPFHKEIFLLSRRHGGICILHDFSMHHFFAAYYIVELKDSAAYEALMKRRYGEAGAVAAANSLLPASPRIWESDQIADFPLFEDVLLGALGVVTHSEFFAARVRDAFPGPVTRIPLAYDIPQSGQFRSREELGAGDDTVLLVSIGHINPNKRVRQVIEALGRLNSDVRPFEYVVLGSCPADHKTELLAAAKHGKVENRVHLLGEVSDEILRSYLKNADVCINLRYPAIEGASGSVIEEMLYGKPVVVNDVGFFQELPADCVVKVQPLADDELAQTLRRLIADRKLRESIGAAAQRYAEQEFRADRYAHQVREFIWEVRSAKPLLGLADRVGHECERMGIEPGNPVIRTMAAEIQNTFCKK